MTSARPAGYQVRVRGHLGAVTLLAFPALHAEAVGRDTLLAGITDQAALHGVLARIEELGLELVEVKLHQTVRGACGYQ